MKNTDNIGNKQAKNCRPALVSGRANSLVQHIIRRYQIHVGYNQS